MGCESVTSPPPRASRSSRTPRRPSSVATPQILKVEAELEEVLPEGEEAVEGAPEVVEAPPEPAEEGGEG